MKNTIREFLFQKYGNLKAFCFYFSSSNPQVIVRCDYLGTYMGILKSKICTYRIVEWYFYFFELELCNYYWIFVWFIQYSVPFWVNASLIIFSCLDFLTSLLTKKKNGLRFLTTWGLTFGKMTFASTDSRRSANN